LASTGPDLSRERKIFRLTRIIHDLPLFYDLLVS
jgi:hypothetical protein